MSKKQKIFKFILPDKLFKEMEEESKKWIITCDCGFNVSVWDVGGIRYKAVRLNGPKKIWGRCPNCKKSKYFSVIKKA